MSWYKWAFLSACAGAVVFVLPAPGDAAAFDHLSLTSGQTNVNEGLLPGGHDHWLMAGIGFAEEEPGSGTDGSKAATSTTKSSTNEESAPTPEAAIPMAAPTGGQSGECSQDEDCGVLKICSLQQCVAPWDVDESQRDSELKINADNWALVGGLVGHLLTTGAGAAALFAPAEMGTMAGITLGLLATTPVAAAAYNSGKRGVGVFGAPGQKFFSWVFWAGEIVLGSVGMIFFIDGVNDTIFVDGTICDGFRDPSDPTTTSRDECSGFKTNGSMVLMNSFGIISGYLMSSSALRVHRQIRRAKRRIRNKHEELQEQNKESFRLNIVPRQASMNGKIDGFTTQATWRF